MFLVISRLVSITRWELAGPTAAALIEISWLRRRKLFCIDEMDVLKTLQTEFVGTLVLVIRVW